jgi:ketosteroid isomerase-like protein
MRAFLLVVVIAAGCREKSEPPATGSAAGTVAAPPVVGRPTRLEEQSVRALVDRWRAAQNDRDFAAYQALYATRMTGVKRVGARVYRFDRAGWIKDRARMFKKPMEVGVDKLAIAVAGPSATVRLEQSFRQGRFRDLGPKQLVVVREGGELRIAREEMLASTVVGATSAAGGGGAAGETFLMLDGEVLLEEDAAVDAKGSPTLDGDQGSASFRARAAVDPAGLEGRARALVGQTFTVYGAGGATCQAKLDRVSLVAGITPHFGTVAEWHGQGSGPALGDGEIAKRVWEAGRTVLVGRPGSCDGLIARAGGPPIVAFEEVSDDKLAASVLVQFRKLDEWEKTQHEFAATDERGAWDKEGAIVHIFRHPTSGKTWAVVHATGGDLCSGFAAEMTAVFEQSGASWKDVSGAGLEQFEPEAAFDLDGDGKPELVAPRVLVGDTGDGFATIRRFDYPDHDCPC